MGVGIYSLKSKPVGTLPCVMWQPEREGNICMCIAELLRCSPETITTLLISYTPIQNEKFFVLFFLSEQIVLGHNRMVGRKQE